MGRRAATLDLIGASLVGLLLVLGCFLLLAVSRNREFQVDEVEHLHAAYNLRDGRMIYRDFWQGHPPLLYALLAPMTDVSDPVASYRRARMLLAVLLLGTIALCAVCARQLGGAWAAALATALALLHTTMIERGIEVRPDGPLALLIMIALAARRFWIQALALGTALLLTQKAIFPLAVFAVLWIWTAWRERRPRIAIQPLLLAAAPLAIGWLVLAAFGAGEPFVRYVFLDATSAAARSENRGTFGPMLFLVRESLRNPMFVLASLAGIAWLLAGRRDAQARFAAILAVGSVAALWLNPFPWPYVHVTFIPLLAVAAGTGIAAVRESWRGIAVAAIVILGALTSVPRLLQKASSSPDDQFATLREIDRLTPRDARCFDLAGLYFRPDAYPVYAMSGDMLVAYGHGAFPRMIPELRRNAVDCILFNYRTAALPGEERQFIAAHFVHLGGNIYLPGTDLSRPAFEVLAPRVFRYEGAGAIEVDGVPFTRGVLARGVHRVHVTRASAPSQLILDTPPPALTGPPLSLFPGFD
jgi:hypothetical protein